MNPEHEGQIEKKDIPSKTDQQQCISTVFVEILFQSCFLPTHKRKQTTGGAAGTAQTKSAGPVPH